MSALIVEQGIASLAGAAGRTGIVVVPRARRGRGRGWADVEADHVVDALEAAGPAAVVLARGPHADPGAAVLGALARIMGRAVVRLPGDRCRAAWVLAVAAHPDFDRDGLLRRLEALAGAATCAAPLPRRAIGDDGPVVPALRPRVLSRWAGCAWQACAHCAGGGPAGGRCGRCGAAGIAVAS